MEFCKKNLQLQYKQNLPQNIYNIKFILKNLLPQYKKKFTIKILQKNNEIGKKSESISKWVNGNQKNMSKNRTKDKSFPNQKNTKYS